MNIKRWTLCLMRGHRWNTVSYPDSEGTGHFLRCRSCGYENHKGTSVRPTGIGM